MKIESKDLKPVLIVAALILFMAFLVNVIFSVSAVINLKKISNELELSKKESLNMKKTIENSKKEYSELSEKYKGLESENKQLTDEIEKLKKENEKLKSQIPSKKTKTEVNGVGRTVYLTFDDGPSKYTPDILNILKTNHIKATFFVINTDYNQYMKNIVEEGHTIALHTYTHKFSEVYKSLDDYMLDLKKINDVVKEKTGIEPKIIRFPGGTSNTASMNYSKGIMPKICEEVTKKGYVYFDWNVDSGDSSGNNVPASTIVSNVKKGLKSTSSDTIVILMHDNNLKHTSVVALPEIIAYIRDSGFEFGQITKDTPVIQHKPVNK